MALFCPGTPRYIVIMKFLSHPSMPTVAKIAAALAVLGAATGLAFASWVDKGAAIFMATVESGLAWCF
jgi:glucokinase